MIAYKVEFASYSFLNKQNNITYYFLNFVKTYDSSLQKDTDFDEFDMGKCHTENKACKQICDPLQDLNNRMSLFSLSLNIYLFFLAIAFIGECWKLFIYLTANHQYWSFKYISVFQITTYLTNLCFTVVLSWLALNKIDEYNNENEGCLSNKTSYMTILSGFDTIIPLVAAETFMIVAVSIQIYINSKNAIMPIRGTSYAVIW